MTTSERSVHFTARLAFAAGLALSSVSAVACSRTPPAAADSSIVASLTRGPCRGFCPEYRVDVYRNGTVRYNGTRNVSNTGAQSATISRDSVRALSETIRASNFGHFDSTYTYGSAGCGRYVTDLPVVTLAADIGTQVKTIIHDPGCSGAPGFLRTLAARIDSVTGTSRWIAGKGAAR